MIETMKAEIRYRNSEKLNLYRKFILFSRVPVSFAFNEGGGALALELSQVLQVGDAVVRFKELELLAGRKISALPATIELLFSRAVPDLAIGRATVAPTGPLAPELHHCAQQAIALIIVLEFFKVGHLCHHFRHLVESIAP